MKGRVVPFAIVLSAVPCLLFGAFEDDVPYLREKWRGDVTDRTTGLGLPELKAEAQRIIFPADSVFLLCFCCACSRFLL